MRGMACACMSMRLQVFSCGVLLAQVSSAPGRRYHAVDDLDIDPCRSAQCSKKPNLLLLLSSLFHSLSLSPFLSPSSLSIFSLFLPQFNSKALFLLWKINIYIAVIVLKSLFLSLPLSTSILLSLPLSVPSLLLIMFSYHCFFFFLLSPSFNVSLSHCLFLTLSFSLPRSPALHLSLSLSKCLFLSVSTSPNFYVWILLSPSAWSLDVSLSLSLSLPLSPSLCLCTFYILYTCLPLYLYLPKLYSL